MREYKDEYWGIMVRDMPVPVYPKTHSLENNYYWYPKALYRYGRHSYDKMHETTCPVCERRTCNEDLSRMGRDGIEEIARRLGGNTGGGWGMNKSQLSEYIIMKVCRSLAQLEMCRYNSKEEWNTWLALMDLLKDPDNSYSKYQEKKEKE